MTLLSLKAMLLKNTSSEKPQKDVNQTEQFLEGASNKRESETQRQLEKMNFWGKLPMF